MAISIKIVKETSLWPYGHLIQWELKNDAISGDYTFAVYRSGFLNGPWDLAAQGLVNTFAFRDTFPQKPGTSAPNEVRPNQLGGFRNFYYKVTVTGPTGETAETIDEVGPTANRHMSNFRRKAIRDLGLVLRKYSGSKVALLKRRRWGTRCLKCVDPRTKEVTRAACVSCWGTGIVDGYWAPVLTYARRSASNNVSVITPEQKSDANDCKIWMPETPTMERDDIVVFMNDQRRYRLDQVMQTEIQLESVHQVLSAQEIARDHVIYKLHVSPDINPLF